MDVAQAQTQLEQTRAQSTDTLGAAPATGTCHRDPARQTAGGIFSIAVGTLPKTPPSIPGLLPSGLLERRPDIAAAERRVAAANANIGVAISA